MSRLGCDKPDSAQNHVLATTHLRGRVVADALRHSSQASLADHEVLLPRARAACTSETAVAQWVQWVNFGMGSGP